jgi:hypothetical protein
LLIPFARRLRRTELTGATSSRPRFKDELHEEHPDLLPAWYVFRDTRAKRRAVQWLIGNSLIDDEAANRWASTTVRSEPTSPTGWSRCRRRMPKVASNGTRIS